MRYTLVHTEPDLDVIAMARLRLNYSSRHFRRKSYVLIVHIVFDFLSKMNAVGKFKAALSFFAAIPHFCYCDRAQKIASKVFSHFTRLYRFSSLI